MQRVRALDVEVAFRAALAAVLPLAILVSLGRTDWSAYAAFGAMTAIFGRGEVYRMRARTVGVAGLGLVASVAAGTAIAAFAAPAAAEAIGALGLAVVLVGGTLLVQVFRLGPPTTLFFVFGLMVTAAVPTPADEYGIRVGLAATSAVFAWLLSMSGWVLRRAAAARGIRPFKDLARDLAVRPAALVDGRVWIQIAQLCAASAIVWVVADLLDLGHPYWALVSAVAAIPPPGAAHTISRAWHRVIGTVGGVVITFLLLWPDPPVQVLVLVIGLAQFGAEILVGRHYGAALLVITPLALVVSHLGNPGPVEPLLVDRLVDTVLGAAAGVLLVLAAMGLDRVRARRA
ncbi:FUSC family protein [Agromyces sp. MMS17-SY077]|uniref:FUSC family protein n=1 Tax=Agromyces seonyuensis TaxID=2662446 RepID=A0A6I4P7Q9_9MICO|nr:FUSC family protein [Agromyces seonyuensis]MWB99904.1 FUSC family protein [Agromyces seonyuensis]